MRERDWLVSQGLAKPGRGRLSRAAKAALEKARAEGMVFDGKPEPVAVAESSTQTTEKKVVASDIKPQPKIREQSVIYAIDKGRNSGQIDIVITLQSCAACNRHVSYCKHEVPVLPKWIDSEVYFEKPQISA